MPQDLRDACARALERELGASVRRDAEQLEACAWDFGRMVHRRPAVVVNIESPEALIAALKIGAEFRLPICTRGSGHSQSGQCLAEGALVLDMKALHDVQIDPERGSAQLQAGATWHQVANAAFAEAHLPVGLTMIVDTTVGGTLSIGGSGCESFRTGTQADQVLELEVALLDGTLQRCSLEHNRALFDAVRAGVGQCGIIVSARYPLRRAKACVRTHRLVYADPQALLADMLVLTAQPRCELMFAGLSWGERAGWQAYLMLGHEFDQASELNDAALLSGLQFVAALPSRDDPQWQMDGFPGHRLFRLYAEPSTGPRPWADHLCTAGVARDLFTRVYSEPAIAPRAGTCAGILTIAAHPNRAPLLLPRASEPLVLFGLYPEPSNDDVGQARARMRAHSEFGCSRGGKRYPSGFFDGWGAREWSEHYGETWPWFRAMKERFDPHGLLNPNNIRWT